MKLRYDDVSATMRAFLGAWEGYRRLGFASEDIFCSVARSARHGGVLSCFAELHTQGKEFAIEVGALPLNVTGELFQEEYKRVSNLILTGHFEERDLDRIWQESECYQKSAFFVQALIERGFRIPGSES